MGESMTARERFKKGDRVQTTEEFATMTRKGQRKIGVVVGFGRQPHLVGVRFDGTKSRYSFHIDYIEPESRSDGEK